MESKGKKEGVILSLRGMNKNFRKGYFEEEEAGGALSWG